MEIKFADILDLVISESEHSESFIEKIYEWKYKKDMFLLQAIIGAIVSIIIAGFYNYKTIIESENSLYLMLFSIIILIIFSIYQYFRIKENKDLFIASIKIYNNIKKFVGG